MLFRTDVFAIGDQTHAQDKKEKISKANRGTSRNLTELFRPTNLMYYLFSFVHWFSISPRPGGDPQIRFVI